MEVKTGINVGDADALLEDMLKERRVTDAEYMIITGNLALMGLLEKILDQLDDIERAIINKH